MRKRWSSWFIGYTEYHTCEYHTFKKHPYVTDRDRYSIINRYYITDKKASLNSAGFSESGNEEYKRAFEKWLAQRFQVRLMDALNN